MTVKGDTLIKRKPILVGKENRRFLALRMIAAGPKELKERNGNQKGGLTD